MTPQEIADELFESRVFHKAAESLDTQLFFHIKDYSNRIEGPDNYVYYILIPVELYRLEI
jgi:hypothetical protein